MPGARCPHTLRILGTRGVPAAHGGFETFAERLALYLVARGWRVVVYCQQEGDAAVHGDIWQGVERVHIAVPGSGPVSTVRFDWRAVLHAANAGDPCLTLGYNTALFCAWLRLRGVSNVINMDGIEWKRAKWHWLPRAWFWLNDWAGCWLGNALIADHPRIADHLATRVRRRKITTIAYGADALQACDPGLLQRFGLEPNRYLLVVARAEPENSLLEMVSAFSGTHRGLPLVVLGYYDSANAYHQAVKSVASAEVIFLGAIYEKPLLQALRWHCLAYVHGHQVGGTNPSLVEAMGASNAVIAHDNAFNRWVVGEGGAFFDGEASMALLLDQLLSDPVRIKALARASRMRFDECFTWERILSAYESTLLQWQPGALRDTSAPPAPR